jgi:Na+/H+ antiporter NhaC
MSQAGDMEESSTLQQFVLTLHSYNVYLVIAAGLVAGVWGLILFFGSKELKLARAKSGEDEQEKAASAEKVKQILKPWRILLYVTAALAALQGLFGVIMLLLGLKPGGGTGLYYLHYVYGAIVALALPVAVTYATGGKDWRRDVLIYSIAALILAAAGVRAWMTGPA